MLQSLTLQGCAQELSFTHPCACSSSAYSRMKRNSGKAKAAATSPVRSRYTHQWRILNLRASETRNSKQAISIMSKSTVNELAAGLAKPPEMNPTQSKRSRAAKLIPPWVSSMNRRLKYQVRIAPRTAKRRYKTFLPESVRMGCAFQG